MTPRPDAETRIRDAARVAGWQEPVPDLSAASWYVTLRRSRHIYVTVQFDTMGRVVKATTADTVRIRNLRPPAMAEKVIAFIESKAVRKK